MLIQGVISFVPFNHWGRKKSQLSVCGVGCCQCMVLIRNFSSAILQPFYQLLEFSVALLGFPGEPFPGPTGLKTDRIMLPISGFPYTLILGTLHCLWVQVKRLAPVAGLKPEPPTHLLRTLTMAEKVALFKFYWSHKNSCCAPPL